MKFSTLKSQGQTSSKKPSKVDLTKIIEQNLQEMGSVKTLLCDCQMC